VNCYVYAWKKSHPEAVKASNRHANRHARRRVLRWKYGVTEEDVRAMERRQGGVCAICSSEKRLVLDHDHRTGRVRGLLCSHCNTMLGFGRDNPDIMRSAIRYLDCGADVEAA
jgi:hypothetical protein